MSTPSIIYDGTLSTITQDGPGWFTLPFESVGDTQSFEWHCYYTQLAANYVAFQNGSAYAAGFIPSIEAMSSVSTSRGTAYLVDESEPTEINGTGWLRFKRTYASLPVTRYEGTSLVYSRQFLTTFADYTWTSPPSAPEVNEWPVPLQGYRKYEYFLSYYPPMIYAPRVNVIYGTVLYIPYARVTAGDSGWPPNYAAPFVAEDSKIQIYKGSIIERMTTYAVWPTTVT